MNVTIKKKLNAGFVLLVLSFILFGLVVINSMKKVEMQFEFVIEHNASVIANANQLLKLVIDMETGQRGFCLTQNEEFLEPFIIASDGFKRLLIIEKELIRDNPDQLRALEEIGDLVNQWHEEAAEPEIHLARKISKPGIATGNDVNGNSVSLKDIAALLEVGTGKALMDKIRVGFAEFLIVEEELTVQRYLNASKLTSTTRVLVYILFIISLYFSFIIALIIRNITNAISNLQKGIKTITSGDLEYRIETKSNDEIGELTNSFNGMVDKRLQAEKAMMKSEKKYRSMMESLEAPIYIGTTGYRIAYMNPAMQKQIGRDATGELCHKAIHGVDTKCTWCHYDEIKKGELGNYEIVSPRDNRTYHVSNTQISYEDGESLILTIFRDMTEFRALESKLRQAHKMESIGTLAGGIAHDFNNILSPIFGYLELSLEKVPEDNPVHDYLTRVLKSAQRASELVKQMLAISRQSKSELQPIRIQNIISEATKLLHASIPSTIEIKDNISRDCGSVMADSTHIYQIIMNLCTNAFHSMEDTGGELNVTLIESNLTIDDLKNSTMVPGPYICLMISDTGHGMEQQVIEKMFDPYFTTKEVGKGTGLGLSVIHGIVNSYNGQINVHSEPGKGSEFKIYLPVIQSRERKETPEIRHSSQKGTETILLIDDEESILHMLKTGLTKSGYQVIALTSSIEALELFRTNSESIDLVISDVTMPVLTGDKLAIEMMKIRRNIPIIICTGFSEIISDEEAAVLGIAGFLTKPVSMRDILGKIREILDNNNDPA